MDYCPPAFALCLLSLRLEEIGEEQSNHDSRAGECLPVRQGLMGAGLTWSGWERVTRKACLSISEQCQ